MPVKLILSVVESGMKNNVVVVGGGIIGLSTAVVLSEQNVNGHKIGVTLVSDKFSPDTTSDGSAGFWQPHAVSNTDETKLRFDGNFNRNDSSSFIAEFR